MTRESIEVTRQDRIYCLKASSDYHSEVCEECRFYPNCDHMTQDDMAELTIKDLEALEQEPKTGHWQVVSDGYGDNTYICECSECKDTVWVYKDADRKWNYCPSCGAIMVELQKSEE